MLAKRIPTILPLMTFEESLETTRIHSVTGLLPSETGLTAARPFRSPHDRVPRIEREAGVLASLNHPNIPAIYGMEDR